MQDFDELWNKFENLKISDERFWVANLFVRLIFRDFLEETHRNSAKKIDENCNDVNLLVFCPSPTAHFLFRTFTTIDFVVNLRFLLNDHFYCYIHFNFGWRLFVTELIQMIENVFTGKHFFLTKKTFSREKYHCWTKNKCLRTHSVQTNRCEKINILHVDMFDFHGISNNVRSISNIE